MEEFQRLEDEGRIDFRHTVTRAASEGWTGRQGRIDASCLEGLIVPGETLCFVCGPPALVGEIPPQLKQLGVGTIRFDGTMGDQDGRCRWQIVDRCHLASAIDLRSP